MKYTYILFVKNKIYQIVQTYTIRASLFNLLKLCSANDVSLICNNVI